MNTVVLDNKKYVLIEKKQFEMLQIKAAQKIEPARKLSLGKGKKHAYELIESWGKESKYFGACCNISCRGCIFY